MKMLRLLTCLTLAALLTACGGGDSGSSTKPSNEGPDAVDATDATDASESEGKKYTIAVIPKGTTHEFWKSIHAGAKKASKELGVDIIWQGPLEENDREGQKSVVESMIAKGVDGIVLAPLDSAALVSPVEEANANGIPTIVIDSGLESEEQVSFVATDNKAGGVAGGEHLAKLLEGKGKVLLLRYMEGSASTTNREEGFLEAIAKHPDIEVISSDQRTGATVGEALAKAEQILLKYKTDDGVSIDGIFSPCEPVTFAVMKVMEDNGLIGKAKHVGFDASEKLVQGLTERKVDALVVQDPVRMGYLGVKHMVEHLKGTSPDKRVDTGVHLVTPDNMKEEAYDKLLNPPLDELLKD